MRASRIHDGALRRCGVSERIYRIPVPAFERFVATRGQARIDVEYRRVQRRRKLGEWFGSAADDPANA
jgi:hypothetical protein